MTPSSTLVLWCKQVWRTVMQLPLRWDRPSLQCSKAESLEQHSIGQIAIWIIRIKPIEQDATTYSVLQQASSFQAVVFGKCKHARTLGKSIIWPTVSEKLLAKSLQPVQSSFKYLKFSLKCDLVNAILSVDWDISSIIALLISTKSSIAGVHCKSLASNVVSVKIA